MMKNNKKWMILPLIFALFLTAGCGTKLEELTDEQREMVVSYSATVIAKFNTYQKDGITAVDKTAVDMAAEEVAEPEEISTIVDSEDTEAEIELEIPDDPEMGGQTELPQGSLPDTETSLAEALGISGSVTFESSGYDVAESYSDGYSADEPSAGMVYVVMRFRMKATADVQINMLQPVSPRFYLTDENGGQTANTTTLLGSDLSTFYGSLVSSEERDVVILFEMTLEQANALKNPILSVDYNNQTNRIK